MKGWKTVTANLGLIALGAYLVSTGAGSGAGQALIAAACANLGLRHITDSPVGYKRR